VHSVENDVSSGEQGGRSLAVMLSPWPDVASPSSDALDNLDPMVWPGSGTVQTGDANACTSGRCSGRVPRGLDDSMCTCASSEQPACGMGRVDGGLSEGHGMGLRERVRMHAVCAHSSLSSLQIEAFVSACPCVQGESR
jgi:hypothetical protein